MYKNTRWAVEILEKQQKDGFWPGGFHTLSNPVPKCPLSTEQALRRLKILGFTIEDEPIKRCVESMHDCLIGKKVFPDKSEKLHDYSIFTSLMISAWIRIFTKNDAEANKIAVRWAKIISEGFIRNVYSQGDYEIAYEKEFGIKPKGGRFVDFMCFYQIALVANCIDADLEKIIFDYILNCDRGIYYILPHPVRELPKEFSSKESSFYLGAIELLLMYKSTACRDKLNFIKEWLLSFMDSNGTWDMGPKSKNGIHFPLSDSWRNSTIRRQDCTYRIKNIIELLE